MFSFVQFELLNRASIRQSSMLSELNPSLNEADEPPACSKLGLHAATVQPISKFMLASTVSRVNSSFSRAIYSHSRA